MSKKTIVIHGATNGSNFGDCLFAYSFYNEILKHNDFEVFFAELPLYGIGPHYRKILDYNKKAGIIKTFNADALVLMSGGYFGQRKKSTLDSVKRYLRYFFLANYYQKHNRKIAIIGIGAGPIYSMHIRHTMKRIVEKADAVSCRDTESLLFLDSLGTNRRIIQTTDSAIAIVDKWKEKKKFTHEDALFIHLGGISTTEALNISNAILALKSKFGINRIFAGNDGLIDDKNADVVDVFREKLGDNFEFIPYTGPFELLSLLAKMNLVITRKLHVGIVSATLGTSVVSFPKHLKVQRFYNQIEQGDRCHEVKMISESEAYKQIDSFYGVPIVLSKDIIDSSRMNFKMLEDFLNSLD